jgi:hypothetical protein
MSHTEYLSYSDDLIKIALYRATFVTIRATDQ